MSSMLVKESCVITKGIFKYKHEKVMQEVGKNAVNRLTGT